MNKKIFHKASEFYEEIRDLRENGVHRGENVGFHSLDEFYTKKLGGTTYIYSAPYSGKSEFAFELALNTAVKYDWITAVFSPESGNKAEIVATLVFKITGKELYAKHRNAVDEELLKAALDFIESHFIFVDPDVSDTGDNYEDSLLTLIEFYKAVRTAEQYYHIAIQETIIDPFNELAHSFEKDAGRQDLYIERMLGVARRDAKMFKRHNTIVTHVADQPAKVNDGKTYYEAATPRQLAGGQAWYRKGMMMISMWRPPVGLHDFDGRPHEENEIHILIQKVKPRYCGKRGTAVLYFDTDTGRYYEKINNKKYYAFQYDKFLKQNEAEGKILMN